MVCDPFISENDLTEGEQLVGLKMGLSRAEVISLHVSGEDEIIGPNEFEQMREGAVLLNSARGGLVNENALIAAVEAGKIGNAWLDVFWDEPYDGLLKNYDQVLLTPHMGTYSRQCRESMEIGAVENLLKDMAAT